jgi:hypothetical protein
MTENKCTKFLAREKYEEAWICMITALEHIESAKYLIGLCNSVHVGDATYNLNRAADNMQTAHSFYKEFFDILTLDCDDEQFVHQSEEEINEALCDPDIMGIHMYKAPCKTCFYGQDIIGDCPKGPAPCNQTTYFYKFLHKDTGERA